MGSDAGNLSRFEAGVAVALVFVPLVVDSAITLHFAGAPHENWVRVHPLALAARNLWTHAAAYLLIAIGIRATGGIVARTGATAWLSSHLPLVFRALAGSSVND
jgi:hypothetical protein